MSGSQHFVLRQTLEWETNRADHRQELTEQLSQVGNHLIPALLEQVLNHLDHPEQVIRLDEIAIELEYDANISLEQWLITALEPALYQAIQAAIDRQLSEDRSLALSDIENLLFFLEHGYLPWNAPEKYSIAELEYRVTEALATSPELAQRLAEKIQNPVLLLRLLRQFSIQMPWRILEALSFYNGLAETYGMKWSPIANSQQEAERLAFWKTTFTAKDLSSEQIEQQIAQQIKAIQEKSPLPDTDQEVSKIPETGVFIQNAGLILLHPYLTTLFEDLDIVQEGKIVRTDNALFALHYAFCGEKNAPEWALVLPKILCGIALGQNIWRSADLTEAGYLEIDHMLETLISHWEVLKNSSVEGLREAFLQRNGRLTESDDYWTLKVEQKSYDMLLDQLPWGIGIIKSPWMHKPIYTEWI